MEIDEGLSYYETLLHIADGVFKEGEGSMETDMNRLNINYNLAVRMTRSSFRELSLRFRFARYALPPSFSFFLVSVSDFHMSIFSAIHAFISHDIIYKTHSSVVRSRSSRDGCRMYKYCTRILAFYC